MATDGSEERFNLTVTWRIENITQSEIKSGRFGVFSSIFRSHSLGGKKLRLLFYPRGKTGVHTFVSLCLCVDDDSLNSPIDCEWSFLGSNGSIIAGGTERKFVLNRYISFPLPSCPTYEEVFVTRQSEFLPGETLTVRCRIRKSHGEVSYHEFVSCRTLVECSEQSFLWPISGFSELGLNAELTTPITFGDSEIDDNFSMKFSLKGPSLEDASVNLELIPVTIQSPLIAALNLAILDKEQKNVKRKENPGCIFDQNDKDGVIFPAFVSRKELLANKSDWLRNDILILHCEIPLIKFIAFIETSCYGFPNAKLELLKEPSKLVDVSCQTTELYICQQRRYSATCLVDDLQSLYIDQNQTDFELRSGDVSFPVHKNILSARSPVFKTMFSTDMKESSSDSLDVPDLDSHTLNRMLTFLYTGTLEPDLQWDNAAKLYYAADKYQIQSLKQHCSCILRSNMSVSNVSDILSLADRHQDMELTSFVHSFVISRFSEIMLSKEWENFMNSNADLAGKTMFELYKKKKSKR